MDLKLTAENRTSTKAENGHTGRQLRAKGGLPAVVYGHAEPAVSILLDLREFSRVYARAGRSHLIDLTLSGGRPAKVLVKDIQHSPRRLGPIHVDFYRVNMMEKLRLEVPVHITGEAPAVTLGDGELYIGLHQVTVECLPGDIPEQLNVDISGLTEIDATIRVGDLKAPEGVTILASEDEVVVKVTSRSTASAEAEEAEAAADEAEGGADSEAAPATE